MDTDQFLDGHLAQSETRLPAEVRAKWAEREALKQSRRKLIGWAMAIGVSFALWYATVEALIWLAAKFAAKGWLIGWVVAISVSFALWYATVEALIWLAAKFAVRG